MLNPGTKLYANTHVVKEVANPKQNPITTSIVLTFLKTFLLNKLLMLVLNIDQKYCKRIARYL